MSHEAPQQEFLFPDQQGGKRKKLVSGYHYNEKGDVVDWEGNIYREDGSLKSTPASPELEAVAEEVRKDPRYRDLDPDDLEIYRTARFWLKQRNRKPSGPSVVYHDHFLD
jgi:hypothetical protein